MIYAWVLILGFGTYYTVPISGIASQAECERLAAQIPIYGILGHRCYRYEMAKP